MKAIPAALVAALLGLPPWEPCVDERYSYSGWSPVEICEGDGPCGRVWETFRFDHHERIDFPESLAALPWCDGRPHRRGDVAGLTARLPECVSFPGGVLGWELRSLGPPRVWSLPLPHNDDIIGAIFPEPIATVPVCGLVFSDGFEGGGARRWSHSVGAGIVHAGAASDLEE